jgi:hypothetical protein
MDHSTSWTPNYYLFELLIKSFAGVQGGVQKESVKHPAAGVKKKGERNEF